MSKHSRNLTAVDRATDPSKPLPDLRWERYAQARAAGEPDAAARRIAGLTGWRRRQTLANPYAVDERVEWLIAELARTTIATPEDVFRLFALRATFDPAIFEGVNSLEDLRTMVSEEMRRALVKGWGYDRKGRFVLQLVDKDNALDKLARHLSFYNDTLRVENLDYDAALARAEAMQAQYEQQRGVIDGTATDMTDTT
jgi:hypothetical protein